MEISNIPDGEELSIVVAKKKKKRPKLIREVCDTTATTIDLRSVYHQVSRYNDNHNQSARHQSKAWHKKCNSLTESIFRDESEKFKVFMNQFWSKCKQVVVGQRQTKWKQVCYDTRRRRRSTRMKEKGEGGGVTDVARKVWEDAKLRKKSEKRRSSVPGGS